MTQKQIMYFRKAYEMRNIASAADALFVSRSVVSRSIQELEEEFGVTFFKRSKNGIVPTEAGVMMYNTVLQLHNCYASLSNRLKELESANAQRTLRVGVTPTNVRPISRLLFGAFQSRYPDVRIQMTEQRSEETIAMLSNGDVDLIVVPGQHVSFSLFEQLPLYDVHVVLAVAKTSPLAAKTRLSVMDLQDHPLGYLATPMPSVEKMLQHSFEAINRAPNVVIRTSAMELLRELTEQGRIGAILPDDMIQDWEGVVGVPLDFVDRVCTHQLVWSKALAQSSPCADFIAFMREHSAGTEPAPPEYGDTASLSAEFFAQLLDLPACKTKGFCDGCGRCEH